MASPQKPPPQDAPGQDAPGLVVKLQILAAVFVPMLLLGLWLRSRGFW